MNSILEIGNAKDGSVVCWRVDARSVTPNTVLAPAEGVMLVVKIGGVSKIKSGTPVTVYGLFNPGKEKKLLGGNKPYGDCEIYAIDQGSAFCAEWGLGGPTAIPCRDPELGAECKAVAFGEYAYRIENYLAFVNSFPFGLSVTREDMREFLRGETAPVIRGVLAGPVMQKGVQACAANASALAAKALEELNARLAPKGLRAERFTIARIDYEGEHLALREKLNATRAQNALKREENEGKRDDLGVKAMEVNEVKMPIVRAIFGRGGEGKTCPACGEKNERDALFCKKCGVRFEE